ncbi:MAG: hypothetical protein Tsb0021_07630 [Chlamydiales bacterium]
MNDKQIKCPGCGASFPEQDGAPHRYGVASSECWQAFNELLAKERHAVGLSRCSPVNSRRLLSTTSAKR